MATKKKLLQATAGESYWIALLGGASDEYARAVAIDSSDNIIVAGYSTANTQAIVAKYDRFGTLLWSRQLNRSFYNNIAYGIAIDSSDNIIIAGQSHYSVEPRDALIVKYDSSGTLQWQRTLGDGSGAGTTLQRAWGVAVDSSDNIIIVGETDSTYLLVAKYDSSGTLQWDKRHGSGATYGRAVAIDSSDNIYVVGYTSDDGAGANDCLIAKYNSSGTLQWDKTLGGANSDFGYGIAIDTSDNIVMVGATGSDGAGSYDILVAKYNSAGALQWDKTLGGVTADYAYGAATDAFDNIIVVGYTSSDGAGGSDGIIAKYDSSGTLEWDKTLGGTGSEFLYSATVDSSNNIIVSGYTNSDGAGNRDFLVAKLPSDGTGDGTYGSLIYQDAVLTDAAAVLTDAAAVLSVVSASLTDSGGSLTDSAISLTEELFEVIA